MSPSARASDMCDSPALDDSSIIGAKGGLTKGPLFPSNGLSQTRTIGYNKVRGPLLSCHSRDIACSFRALGVGYLNASSTSDRQ
jgi:hypothetical protein